MKNVFYCNKQQYVITPFDNQNVSDVAFALKFLKEHFSNAFDNAKSNVLKYGPSSTEVLSNGFFVENESGKKVGCVLFGPKSYNVPLVDYKHNTLFIHYLMVSKNYREKGLGTKLIRSVMDYAKQNNYDYIELLSAKHLFETRGNVYEHNNFKKIATYDSASNPFKKNVVFRINTNEFITNISDYIFSEMRKEGLSKIDEQKLISEINKNYGDIIKIKTNESEFVEGLKLSLQKYKATKNAKKVSGTLKAKQTLSVIPFLKKSKYGFNTYSDLIKVFDDLDDLSKNLKIERELVNKKNKLK